MRSRDMSSKILLLAIVLSIAVLALPGAYADLQCGDISVIAGAGALCDGNDFAIQYDNDNAFDDHPANLTLSYSGTTLNLTSGNVPAVNQTNGYTWNFTCIKSGTYYFNLTAEETNQCNVTLDLSLNTGSPESNLSLYADAPASVNFGDSFNLNVTIDNTGNGTAYGITQTVDSSFLDNITDIESLENGTASESIFTITPTSCVSSDTISVYVSNYHNGNNLSLPTISKTIMYDVLGSELSMISGSVAYSSTEMYSDETLTIDAVVENNGNITAANPVITFYSNTTELGNISIENITARGNASVSFSTSLPLGSHTLYASFASDNECPASNQQLPGSISVTERPAAPSSSGGGKSGNGNSRPVGNAIQNGIEQKMRAGDRIRFQFKDSTHTVSADEVSQRFVRLTVRSEPQTFTIRIAEEKKIDIDKDNTYDLYVAVNRILGSEATVYFKLIDERIAEESGKEEPAAQPPAPPAITGQKKDEQQGLPDAKTLTEGQKQPADADKLTGASAAEPEKPSANIVKIIFFVVLAFAAILIGTWKLSLRKEKHEEEHIRVTGPAQKKNGKNGRQNNGNHL